MAVSAGENLGLEFTELRPGLRVPSIDAMWRKAAPGLEMAVRYKHRWIQVHRTRGGPGFDHIYEAGSIACDGCCIYRHAQGTGPELCFRIIQKKIVDLIYIGSRKSGELNCQIICSRTGNKNGSLTLRSDATLAGAKRAVEDFLRSTFKLIGETALEIRTFEGRAGHAKLKSIWHPQPSTKKQKTQHIW
jgi:hypothetical protein